LNNLKPAIPTPQEQAESDQDGHPTRVMARGREGIRRREGAGISLLLTADERG